MTTPRIRFTKVREVHSPTRNNVGDAGLDFYMPTDLSISDLINANSEKANYDSYAVQGSYSCILNDGKVESLVIGPHTRVVIPSGVRVLLEPSDSMMQVNNKSGRSTKQGLIFTAQVCDSPYTGEYHIGIYNTSEHPQMIKAGEAVVQFIHIPVFSTIPEEITLKEYKSIAESWGTRGSKGMGSGNNKARETNYSRPEDIEGD